MVVEGCGRGFGHRFDICGRCLADAVPERLGIAQIVVVARQQPPGHALGLAHGGKRLAHHRRRGRGGVERVAGEQDMRRALVFGDLREAGNGAVAGLHQPAADVAIGGLGDVGELPTDMQVGGVQKAQGHRGSRGLRIVGAAWKKGALRRRRALAETETGTSPGCKGFPACRSLLSAATRCAVPLRRCASSPSSSLPMATTMV